MRASLFATLIAVPALAAPTSLIGVTNNAGGLNDAEPETGTLARFDPETGDLEDAAVVNRAGFAMAWDATTGRTYAVQQHDGGAQLLTQVDPRTLGIRREIGALVDADDATVVHRITALAADDDGALWGVAARRTFVAGLPVPVGYLVRIEPETGRTTEVGSLGFAVFSRGAAIHEGALILVSNRDRADLDLYAWRIDLSDASAELLGPTGVAGRAVGLGQDEDGQLWAALGDETSILCTLDPETGEATELFDTGLQNLSGFAWIRELWIRRLKPSTGRPTADHALAALAIDPAGVAEARIGDLGGPRTFELAAGRVTAAPDASDDFAWSPGERVPFEVRFDAADDRFIFDVDGTELSMPPYGAGRDLTLRARATHPDARARLTDLTLQGHPLGLDLDTASPRAAGGIEVVHVHSPWLDDGFVLTGTLIFDWSPRHVPRNSQLAVQIGWGDARAPWR